MVLTGNSAGPNGSADDANAAFELAHAEEVKRQHAEEALEKQKVRTAAFKSRANRTQRALEAQRRRTDKAETQVERLSSSLVKRARRAAAAEAELKALRSLRSGRVDGATQGVETESKKERRLFAIVGIVIGVAGLAVGTGGVVYGRAEAQEASRSNDLAEKAQAQVVAATAAEIHTEYVLAYDARYLDSTTTDVDGEIRRKLDSRYHNYHLVDDLFGVYQDTTIEDLGSRRPIQCVSATCSRVIDGTALLSIRYAYLVIENSGEGIAKDIQVQVGPSFPSTREAPHYNEIFEFPQQVDPLRKITHSLGGGESMIVPVGQVAAFADSNLQSFVGLGMTYKPLHLWYYDITLDEKVSMQIQPVSETPKWILEDLVGGGG